MQNALEGGQGYVFVVHGESDAWLWAGSVKESGVTASLVVDIKARTL